MTKWTKEATDTISIKVHKGMGYMPSHSKSISLLNALDEIPNLIFPEEWKELEQDSRRKP